MVAPFVFDGEQFPSARASDQGKRDVGSALRDERSRGGDDRSARLGQGRGRGGRAGEGRPRYSSRGMRGATTTNATRLTTIHASCASAGAMDAEVNSVPSANA